MVLTEEQKERIRINRERALEIRRRRKREAEEAAAAAASASPVDSSASKTKAEGDLVEEGKKDANKRRKVSPGSSDTDRKVEDDDDELEEFEMGASDLVTKKEAMKMYCLPEGTLAVCGFVEKTNPHNKSWTPMKLYDRAEIRRRARARHGGRQGLFNERRRREEKRFQKDLEKVSNIFR